MEQTIAEDVCACIGYQQLGIETQEEKKEILNNCLIASLKKHKEAIKNDSSAPPDKNGASGKEYGQEVGKNVLIQLKRNCLEYQKHYLY